MALAADSLCDITIYELPEFFSGSPVGMMEWASYPRKGHLSVYDIQTICVDNGIFPETSAGECNENVTLFRN